MKSVHLYEVKLIDGTLYRCEIPYRDDKMIIIRSASWEREKVRLYYNGILSIRELGWTKVPVTVGGDK